jgi:predicted phosphodiesterase
MKIALTSDTHYGHSYKTHRIHERFLRRLAAEDFDVLVHCGDWISDAQHQLPRTLKMFRKAMKERPILTVIGNHDLWDSCNWGPRVKKKTKTYDRSKTYRTMAMDHHDWMLEHNIHHLAWKPYKLDDHVFFGFDGWYYQIPVRSNDPNYMPRLVDGNCPIDLFLTNEAHVALDSILEQASDTNKDVFKICCTHHAPYTKDSKWSFLCANPRFLDPITENMDMFFVGHSHKREEWTHNGCAIYNCGADYNMPKYMIIDTSATNIIT